jgi:hypothetical protein
MQKPRRFSTLRFRLSAAVSAITLMSILLLAALFVWKDFDKTISGERARLSSIATAYAAAAADAAAGRDQREMLEVLRGIGALPDIVFAGISAPDGQVIAEIGGSVVLAGQDGLLAEADEDGNTERQHIDGARADNPGRAERRYHRTAGRHHGNPHPLSARSCAIAGNRRRRAAADRL